MTEWLWIAAGMVMFALIFGELRIYKIRREWRRHEEIFQVVTENAADMIALVDVKGRRLYNSPAYKRILGYSTAELVETSSFEQSIPTIGCARWNHPTQGLISPYRFIEAAEDTGILVSIGHWLIVQACLQLREWEVNDRSGQPMNITVNLSARQLADARLANDIQDALQQIELTHHGSNWK